MHVFANGLGCRTIELLEGGDLKLRVRDLDGQRAARRSSIMQVRRACMNKTCVNDVLDGPDRLAYTCA